MVTIACHNCEKGNYCQYHKLGSKLATGVQYSKRYEVYDLESGELRNLTLRSQDRKNNPYIEIEEKTATCTKCRTMDVCKNYYVTSRSGGANVCICNFCIDTQYANQTELMGYVKQKLLKRYNGEDYDLLRLLKS